MYSTPGTSRSSFSIGMVTRCSTSADDAPGICTNTSSMGTTICGSSSRGVCHTANPPSSRAAMMARGVSFEAMNACATLPAARSVWFISVRHLFAGQFAPARRGHQALAARESGENLNIASGRLAQGHVTQRDLPVCADHVHALDLSALQDGSAWDDHRIALAACEANAPEQPGAQARIWRQLELHDEAAAGWSGGGHNLDDLGRQFRAQRLD